MRKCYLDNLPKKKYGDKNIINWVSSIGCIVNFKYDNIEGRFQILEVNTKDGELKVLYNGLEFESASYCAKVSKDVFGVEMLSSKISSVCNGTRNSYLGFRFKYKHDTDNRNLDKFKNNKLAKEVCYLKNNNPNIMIKDIASKYGIGRSTVRNYLKRGTELGWCDYNPKEESKVGRSNLIPNKSVRVEVFKDNISCGIFNSVSELESKSEELFGVKFIKGVLYRACRGEIESYKGYTFRYVKNKESDMNV